MQSTYPQTTEERERERESASSCISLAVIVYHYEHLIADGKMIRSYLLANVGGICAILCLFVRTFFFTVYNLKEQ